MDFLYLLDHLYVSRVKFSNFLYPLSIMTKRGRNCGFFLQDSTCWGRNTCLCKGEMCFIMLGGVLTSFFLYIRSCDHFYTYIVLILFICGCMFLSLTLTCIVSFLSLCGFFLNMWFLFEDSTCQGEKYMPL